MPSVHPQPLPQLPPEDQSLLTAYFAANEDLSTLLTKDAGTPHTLLSLLHWLSRPEIAAYIHAYRAHQTQLHRNSIITALESALKTTTDPIEIRRAATTFLRALNPTRLPRPESPVPLVPPTSMRSRPSSPIAHPPQPRSPLGTRDSGLGTSPVFPLSTPSPISQLPTPHLPLSPSRPTLSQALAILGIPELTDEEEDALEDGEIDALDDEDNDDDDLNDQNLNTDNINSS